MRNWKIKKINYLTKKSIEGVKKLKKKYKRKKITHKNNVEPKLNENKEDLIAFLISKKFYNKFYKNNNDECNIIIPDDFRISTNPDPVIKCLKNMFMGIISKRIKRIHFDHTKCQSIDLSASALMDSIVLSALSSDNNLIKNCKGKYFKDNEVGQFLDRSGLTKHLCYLDKDFTLENNYENIDKNYIGYDLKPCNYNLEADKITTEITKYYNKCLKTQGLELNEKGENFFFKIIGEIIANCNDHGNKKIDWYVQGHYCITKNNIGKFYLTIFNFGDSIYELLKKETTDETLKRLNNITTLHNENFDNNWNEEMLWTLYALQDGVSRLRDSSSSTQYSRGTGTITFIDAFYSLGKNNSGKEPIMSITSGNTHIIFNSNYTISEDGIIAFNKENDLNIIPDFNNVKKIKNYFPGTIINIDMYIDRDYLVKYKEGDA